MTGIKRNLAVVALALTAALLTFPAAADEPGNGNTVAGSTTTLVKDINQGSDSCFPSRSGVTLAAVGDTLFFAADDGNTGIELWKSDGSETGTVLVKDINPGTDSSLGPFSPYSEAPDALISVGDTLFFAANDGNTGMELWKSDGTEAGTALVKDIDPGPDGSLPEHSFRHFTAVGDTLFFAADDGNTGYGLWKSEAPYNDASTSLVKDLRLAGDPSHATFPVHLTAVGDTLFFRADDGIIGSELWKSDGTLLGTVPVKDISEGRGHSSPRQLTAVGDTLFFSAQDRNTGRELWKSDGTMSGTVRVKNIDPSDDSITYDNSGPYWLTAVGDTLFFTADDGTIGRELWKSEAPYEDASTTLVKDINPDPPSPMWLTAVGDTLFFTADDGTTGRELWKSDGTEAGTVLVKDIMGSGSSFPSELAGLGDTLFFSAQHWDTWGHELWKSEAPYNDASTTLVEDINPGHASRPNSLTPAGNTLFFTADDGTTGRELWKTLGSSMELTAQGSKVKGKHVVDLSWTGAQGTSVEIFRDGSLIATTDNGGAYTDHTGNKGKGSYTYQVCEAGTSTCSNEVTVVFG